jgi:hypothetical protein
MATLQPLRLPIKLAKRVSRKLFPASYPNSWWDCCGQAAGDLIRNSLLAPEPCMIARLGIVEMNAIYASWEINSKASLFSKVVRTIRGEINFYDWDPELLDSMVNNTGFFPANEAHLKAFADRMLLDIPEIDILGAWWPGEYRLYPYLPAVRCIPLKDLEPYYHPNPWSEVLAN